MSLWGTFKPEKLLGSMVGNGGSSSEVAPIAGPNVLCGAGAKSQGYTTPTQ